MSLNKEIMACYNFFHLAFKKKNSWIRRCLYIKLSNELKYKMLKLRELIYFNMEKDLAFHRTTSLCFMSIHKPRGFGHSIFMNH